MRETKTDSFLLGNGPEGRSMDHDNQTCKSTCKRALGYAGKVAQSATNLVIWATRPHNLANLTKHPRTTYIKPYCTLRSQLN